MLPSSPVFSILCHQDSRIDCSAPLCVLHILISQRATWVTMTSSSWIDLMPSTLMPRCLMRQRLTTTFTTWVWVRACVVWGPFAYCTSGVCCWWNSDVVTLWLCFLYTVYTYTIASMTSHSWLSVVCCMFPALASGRYFGVHGWEIYQEMS